MDLLVVGMNHKTAPVEIRERFSFGSTQIAQVNRLLKESASLEENLVLSTCNRIEIYAIARHKRDHIMDIEGFLGRFHNLNIFDYKDRLYVHRDKAAVEHLFKVASGLDSMVIGEMEILGQVKKAYQEARESRTTGKVLNRLFEKAFHTAKEIRTETFVSRGAVSVSSVATHLAKKILGQLRGKKVLIVGAGKMGEQSVLYLKNEGIGSILVANRTFEKAWDLAARFGARAIPFEDFKSKLTEIDIVITSTGAPHYIIYKDDISSLMPARKQRPLFIIDLAVPRDVEAQVNQIDNVYLYDIDDLQKTVNETISLRRDELDSCFQIIRASSEKFLRWLVTERLTDE
jgi:glutamyl-tRNA reductase